MTTPTAATVYTVTNNLATNFAAGHLSLSVGQSVNVTYLDNDLLNAYSSGNISISPTPPLAGNSALTMVGTPSTTAIADVSGSFVQATLNNNFATLTAQINNLNAIVANQMATIAYLLSSRAI